VIAIVVGVAGVVGAALGGCATTDQVVAFEDAPSRDGAPPLFEAPDTGGEAGPDAAPKRGQCATTHCPVPYASCPVREDRGGFLGLGPPVPPIYACSTNLAKDDDNCGACGLRCPRFLDPLGIQVHCIEGTCQSLCLPNKRDCNAIAEDGCEVDIRTDPKHCGLCGHACNANEVCREGACVDPNQCVSPLVRCGDACVDLATDALNCSACGYDCGQHEPDGGRPALPPHMVYACVAATCGVAICATNWANCNGSMVDGCEQSLNDPANCGKCGTVCQSFETCAQPLGSLTFTCIASNPCTDTDKDPANCGSCGYVCPNPVLTVSTFKNGATSCTHGRCDYACKKGFADCNGRDEDGCEADLAHDPRNCGGCGQACPVAGQPCVDGECATTSCDAGVTR
jgi:hypothetical protein